MRPAHRPVDLGLLADIERGATVVDWPALVCGTPDELTHLIAFLKAQGTDDAGTVSWRLPLREWTLLLGFVYVSPEEALSERLLELEEQFE